jgi:hypothetical protein
MQHYRQLPRTPIPANVRIGDQTGVERLNLSSAFPEQPSSFRPLPQRTALCRRHVAWAWPPVSEVVALTGRDGRTYTSRRPQRPEVNKVQTADAIGRQAGHELPF